MSRFVHAGGPTEDALFDYIAGRLHPQAGEWIAAHVSGCARCTAAVEQVSALHEALEPPPISPFQRQSDITAVRRRLEQPRPLDFIGHPPRHSLGGDASPRSARLAGWSRLVLGGSLAFAVLALVVFIGLYRVARPHGAPPELTQTEPSPTPVPVNDTAEVPWTVLAREGGADLQLGDNHAVLRAQASVPVGGLVVLQPGARVAARWGQARVVVDGAQGGARLRLEVSQAGERRLRLERGRVALDVDPLKPGATLAVATEDELVTVHGTVFSVQRTAAGTTVAVERGRVRVVGHGRKVELTAGAQLPPGASAPEPLEAEGQAALRNVESLAALEPVGESLEVLADVPAAEVAVDGVAHGRAPLSLAVAPGVHRVRVTAEGRLPVDERIEVVPGTPALLRAELRSAVDDIGAEAEPPETRSERTRGPSEKPAPRGKSAVEKDPMAAARAEVMAGKYGQAIERLEALRQRALPPTDEKRALLLEAQAYRLQLKPERAVPLLEKAAVGRGPEAEQGQMMLAQALGRDLADPRRAAVAWAEAQRRFPTGIFREEASFRLGESLVAAGQPREGVEALEQFLARFPAGTHADDAHLLIAQARRDRLSDCTGAIPHLQAVANGPRGLSTARGEMALIGAARCLKQVGRLDEAKRAYRRYLDQLPRGRFADEASKAVK